MALRRLSEAIQKVLGNNDEQNGPLFNNKFIPSPSHFGSSSDASPTAPGSFFQLNGDLNEENNEEDAFFEDFQPHYRVGELRRSWPQTEDEAAWRLGMALHFKDSEEEEGEKTKPNGKVDISLLNESFTADGGSSFSNNHADPFSKQVINWEPISEDAVSGNSRSTVWNCGSGKFDIEVDEKEISKIISMFSFEKQARKKFSLLKSSSNAKESVLDHRRSTTVSVAMKRMRLQPSKFGKLAWALRDMNESYLTPAAIEIMKDAQLWASSKEIEAMRVKVREGAELADPDALLWFLTTAVPDTAMRVNALSFRYEFDELFGELIRATSLIKAASMEVTNSELLKRLMRVILLVGNNINETFDGSPAWGITLDSLRQLKKIRTADKTLSVLDCIVAYLDQMAPETFEVADDCTCVPSAARYSLSDERKIVNEARKGLEAIRKFKPMEKFYLNASKKILDIERDIQAANEAFDRALDHFCIPRGSIDTDKFFGALADFFTDFDQAIKSLEARQKQMANPNQLRSGLMNPAFMKMRRESSMSFNSTPGNASKAGPGRQAAYRPSVFGRLRPGE